MTSEQESNQSIGPADIKINNEENTNTEIQCFKKNQSFLAGKKAKINLIAISKNQPISVGTGLIPFLEHDDANRALMGSNMQRQALPLLKKEMPLIETGIEEQIAKASQSTKISKNSGIIKYTSIKKIIIEGINKKWKNKNNTSVINKYKNLEKTKKIPIQNCKSYTYSLENSRKSNQNNNISQNPIVRNKEWIKRGQIIADGIGTNWGKLSLGKNLLVAYMSWKGYNFEDAIVINKRVVTEDILTSIHMKRYKVFLMHNEKEGVRYRILCFFYFQLSFKLTTV